MLYSLISTSPPCETLLSCEAPGVIATRRLKHVTHSCIVSRTRAEIVCGKHDDRPTSSNMDPVTALGLAANVLGVIDFTARFAVEISEVLRSTGDALPQNEWFDGVAKQNQALSREIDAASQNQQLSRLDQDVCELARRCNTESQHLIAILDPLRAAVKNGVKSKRDVVWKAFKTELLKSNEIATSQARLERLELQLSTLLLQSIRTSQAEEFDSVKKLIASRGDDAVSTMRFCKDEVLLLLRTLHDEALLRIKATEENTKRLEALLLNAVELAQVDRILSSLSFPEMNSRVDAVDERHRNSFDWIFAEEQSSGTNVSFKTWLSGSDSSIFWVCGELGSGKSVLMKTLRRHTKTIENLQVWASQQPFVICEYYFWIAGTSPLQKSAVGMLRTIAHQMITRFPGLLADPTLRSVLLHSSSQGSAWTSDVLLRAISSIGAQVKLCLFIDGLDECDGGPRRHQGLVQNLDRLSSLENIKICVSSRPWDVFEDAYRSIRSRILLQKLTENDIFRFVVETLTAADPVMFPQEVWDGQIFRSWVASVARKDDLTRSKVNSHVRAANHLICEITLKAEGSFLWTALVLDSLCTRLEGGESLAQISRHLEIVPQKLEEYYESSILERIAETYRSPRCSETAMALKLAEAGINISRDVGLSESPLLCFWLLRQRLQYGGPPRKSPDIAALPHALHEIGAERSRVISQTRRYLSSCCRGLLRVSSVEYWYEDGGLATPPQFRHRTILDFLQSDRGQKVLSDGLPEAFEEITDEILFEAMLLLAQERDHYPCPILCRMIWWITKGHSQEQARIAFWEQAMVRWVNEICPMAVCITQCEAHYTLVSLVGCKMPQILGQVMQKRRELITIARSYREDYQSSFLTYLMGMYPERGMGVGDYYKSSLSAVELALSHGANPNAFVGLTRYDKTAFTRTIWHVFLALLVHSDCNRTDGNDAGGVHYEENEYVESWSVDCWALSTLNSVADHAQFAKLLIRYGADVQSEVCVERGKCLSIYYTDPYAFGQNPALVMDKLAAIGTDSIGHDNAEQDRGDPEEAQVEIWKDTTESGTPRGSLEAHDGRASEHSHASTHASISNKNVIRQSANKDSLNDVTPQIDRVSFMEDFLSTLTPDVSPNEPNAAERSSCSAKDGSSPPTRPFTFRSQHEHDVRSVRDILSLVMPHDDREEVLALVDEYSKPEKAAEVKAARLAKLEHHSASELALADLVDLGRSPDEYMKAVDVENDAEQLQVLLDVYHNGIGPHFALPDRPTQLISPSSGPDGE